jgi:hypothetical protein
VESQKNHWQVLGLGMPRPRWAYSLHGLRLPRPSQGSLGSLLYFGLRVPSQSSRGVPVRLILEEFVLSIFGVFWVQFIWIH